MACVGGSEKTKFLSFHYKALEWINKAMEGIA